jgi:hypothetical protein
MLGFFISPVISRFFFRFAGHPVFSSVARNKYKNNVNITHSLIVFYSDIWSNYSSWERQYTCRNSDCPTCFGFRRDLCFVTVRGRPQNFRSDPESFAVVLRNSAPHSISNSLSLLFIVPKSIAGKEQNSLPARRRAGTRGYPRAQNLYPYPRKAQRRAWKGLKCPMCRLI